MVRISLKSDTVTWQERLQLAELFPTAPEAPEGAVRSHWGIENSCHWALAMVFRDGVVSVLFASAAGDEGGPNGRAAI